MLMQTSFMNYTLQMLEIKLGTYTVTILLLFFLASMV